MSRSVYYYVEELPSSFFVLWPLVCEYADLTDLVLLQSLPVCLQKVCAKYVDDRLLCATCSAVLPGTPGTGLFQVNELHFCNQLCLKKTSPPASSMVISAISGHFSTVQGALKLPLRLGLYIPKQGMEEGEVWESIADVPVNSDMTLKQDCHIQRNQLDKMLLAVSVDTNAQPFHGGSLHTVYAEGVQTFHCILNKSF
jgi:hypothetical protein